jgi:hypothetical protein
MIIYKNFWSHFNKDNFWLEAKIKISKDITVSSVFFKNKNSIETLLNNKSFNILYSFENLYNPQFDWIIKYLSDFDLVIGINDIKLNNYIRLPASLAYHINGSESENYSAFMYKNKNICMVSKNPHSLRIKMINEFKNRDVKVDCGGPLLNNIGYNVVSKCGFLKNYYFNICPENSYAKGYCSEKIYQALLSNCIPIYWGDLSCDKHIVNTNKILHIHKDYSNLESIVDRCVFLLKNKNELYSMLIQPSFSVNNLQKQNALTMEKIHQALQ